MPLRARLLGWIWSAALRLLALTWRKRPVGLDGIESMLADRRRFIAVFWHGGYIAILALLRVPGGCIFTSRSFRGDVIAAMSRSFGLRAEEAPGGGASLESMRSALAESPAGAIAVDGPLGPRHDVKRGAVILASELGFALVPVSVASRRKWVLAGRWDRMEIPRPFTTVQLEVGEPIEVPPELDESGLDRWSQRVHEELVALDERVARAVGGEPAR